MFTIKLEAIITEDGSMIKTLSLTKIIQENSDNFKMVKINNLQLKLSWDSDFEFFILENLDVKSSSSFKYSFNTDFHNIAYLSTLRISNKKVKINSIEVKKEFRHKGIATFLYNFVKNFLKTKNITLIHSNVLTDDGYGFIKSLKMKMLKEDDYS